MKKLQPILAFKRVDKQTSTMGKLIGWYTKSPVYHVEVILEDKWISAYAGRGVYVNDLRPLKDTWEYIKLDEIMVTQRQDEIIEEWLQEQDGKGYDYLGILLAQLIPLRLHSRAKWFCSEITTKILQLLFIKETMNLSPYDVSPGDLHGLFKKDKKCKKL